MSLSSDDRAVAIRPPRELTASSAGYLADDTAPQSPRPFEAASSKWVTPFHLAAKVRIWFIIAFYWKFDRLLGRPKDSLYEPALQDSEREAVADLLQYLEQVRI